MNLKYSPEYEDMVFGTRFFNLELEYTKIEKGLELESDGNILTVIKEILLLLKSKDTSNFLTDNCVAKIIKRKLSPSNFNIKMLENIDKENLKFYDAMIFASAYKYFIEGKHVQPSYLELFTQIQEKFYEKRQFVKFEPLKFAGEIRVGLITEIVSADNSDKLYVEQVSFGREKQIVSGLKHKFKPEDLLNKSFLFLTNIKPKKVGGNLSEGMILCAKSDNDFEILDGTDFHPGSILHYNDGFQVVQTYIVPNLDLQSEKGKSFMNSLSVKDGVFYFKDSAFYCEGQKFYTKIVKNGTIS